MERLTSRKNRTILHLKELGRDGEYRKSSGEYLCDGEKLLQEAISSGAEIKCILWRDGSSIVPVSGASEFICPEDILKHVSPLKNSPGPVFSVKIPEHTQDEITQGGAVILENVQDPGNVGTVIRTANALGIKTVILVGDCADLYNPKTVRSTMGGVFRQRVIETELKGLEDYVNQNGLTLLGAALSENAKDIRKAELKKAAVAIGSEGSGLSNQLLNLCDGSVIIPMEPGSESLNAAVAAAICMWEMTR